jgi:hypothetical protein
MSTLTGSPEMKKSLKSLVTSEKQLAHFNDLNMPSSQISTAKEKLNSLNQSPNPQRAIILHPDPNVRRVYSLQCRPFSRLELLLAGFNVEEAMKPLLPLRLLPVHHGKVNGFDSYGEKVVAGPFEVYEGVKHQGIYCKNSIVFYKGENFILLAPISRKRQWMALLFDINKGTLSTVYLKDIKGPMIPEFYHGEKEEELKQKYAEWLKSQTTTKNIQVVCKKTSQSIE